MIHAELAGVDPARDVDVTVEHGILRIAAERRDEKTVDDKAYRRRGLRHGAFRRELVLPEGATADDVKAAYKDGILEIRVTVPPRRANPKPHLQRKSPSPPRNRGH